MIYLNFPVGGMHGWGVCGKYVALHLANLSPLCLLTNPFTPELDLDELSRHELHRLLPSPTMAQQLDLSRPVQLDGPLLAGAPQQLSPWMPNLKGTRTVGYCFFETTTLLPGQIEFARQHYDHIATGSTWLTNLVRGFGVENVSTVIQGIDPAQFHPIDLERSFLRDRFVVFSGGKFEFRKGQDIVIRAFKVLQDRHPDAVLVYAWQNPLKPSFATMGCSPFIRFDASAGNDDNGIRKILSDNGVDPARSVGVSARSHHAMASVYHNSDVGIFPNRAEGGTNLVLMEYLACGKPVIATASTGHADIVNRDNAMLLDAGDVVRLRDGEKLVTEWPQANLEQAIEQLEFAYQNRDATKRLAIRGSSDMQKLTWRHTAEAFVKLLVPT